MGAHTSVDALGTCEYYLKSTQENANHSPITASLVTQNFFGANHEIRCIGGDIWTFPDQEMCIRKT